MVLRSSAHTKKKKRKEEEEEEEKQKKTIKSATYPPSPLLLIQCNQKLNPFNILTINIDPSHVKLNVNFFIFIEGQNGVPDHV